MTEPDDTRPARWPAFLARPHVVIPYVTGSLHERTRQAVEDQTSGHYEAIRIDPADPFDYGRQLAALWPGSHALIVVEQDIVAPEGAIEELAECPEPWCTFFYSDGTDMPAHGLGLVKFSQFLQVSHPFLANQASRSKPGAANFTMPWNGLSGGYEQQMAAYKIPRHQHGTAEHLHDYGD